MKVWLSPRAFAALEAFCRTPDGKHKAGGIQNRRRKWKEQLDMRRGHMTQRERNGPTPEADRWLELDEGDVESIKSMRERPQRGTWQRQLQTIFGGIDL